MTRPLNTKTHFISERNLVAQAYVWIGLPVILFLGFWFRPVIGIPVIGLFIYGVIRSVMLQPSASATRNIINLKWWMMLLTVVVYVTVSGIGGFVAQIPNDHLYRNAVFYDLARNDWPVMHEGGKMLCYYFLFWLPAAIPAKLTGFIRVGDVAQILWAAWGTWIAINFIIMRCGGRALWRILFVFIFFNCWDWLTASLFTDLEFKKLLDPYGAEPMWYSTTSHRFANSSNCIVYNYIYNQGISVWVVMSLLLHTRKQTGTLMLTFSTMPLLAPIPALAFVPYISYRLLKDIRNSITIENITGLVIALLGSSFLLQNNTGQKLMTSPYHDSLVLAFLLSLAYYCISVLPFIPFIWKYVRRNGLYLSLFCVPVFTSLFSFGKEPDLAWRSALPLILLTDYYVCCRAAELYNVKKFYSSDHKKSRRLKMLSAAFYGVLLLGSISPTYIIWRAGYEQMLCWEGKREEKYIYMMDRLHRTEYNNHVDNFICEGDSFYRRYLMPRRTSADAASNGEKQ